MKYQVTINEEAKSVTVNLDGYIGVSKCCPTDSFNLSTGIELALERAKVAKKNAEEKSRVNNHNSSPKSVMELVKALEKALPKGQMVIVGNGDGLTAEQKRWLLSLSGHKCPPSRCHCEGECYTEDEIEDIRGAAYDEGYEDGRNDADDRYDEGYEDGYDEGYDDGYSEAEDEYEDETSAEELADRVRAILDELEV